MAGEKSAKERLPQNWMLFGTHVRFLEAARDAWIALWGGEDGAEIVHAPEVPAGALLSALNTFPMFRARQVVRLVHAEEASPETLAALSGYLANPSGSTALLIECAMDLSKRPPSCWAKIMERVKSKDCTVRSAASFIKQRATVEGFEVEPQAVAALEEWANRDFSLLPGALDLLFLYRAREKHVREEDVESMLGAGGTPKLWALQDFLLKRERSLFLKTLAEIELDPEQAPLAFVGMISKQMRFLLHLRGLMAAGARRSEINPQQLDKYLKPFQLNQLFSALSFWPEADIRAAFDRLYNLDLALKGDPGEPWALVERHLMPCFNDRQ